MQKIAEKYPLDMVVVACNTASTVVLPALREKFAFPIVGTVPAIKPAAAISQTKTIGLLATKGTVERPYVAELIEKYAKDCIVEKIGTTTLVELVEEKIRTGNVDQDRLSKVVAEWQTHPTLDTVILGCTHFPLVKQELQQLLPKVKFFIDPGNGIANRVATLLSEFSLENSAQNKENIAFCTKMDEEFSKREIIMQQWGFKRLELLNLSQK
ncbi:putative glutamate racemase [Actinobacillus pleuropneumoniae]|nr:putative glutamate racemase [Actinobacillus pleuropneumoniae]KIE88480.1 putative glutamate racemase [Actinobacillus pleuropneumoniae]KIE88511.1 putative glutamate racemase [Actinobacillus pleuropneumoniae]KIE95094.1 putative glutamate racemase [Actinobacillus pleuropneumoniae]KIE95317.1 putative glutamate racemase [Actinobacillus pleuropneumoniae]